MTMPFLGEIKMTGFRYAPKGWATCDGQLVSIAQNQALYSLFGTHFGGDGITTFALPELRGRVPVHMGSDVTLGQAGGVEQVTLTLAEMPAHSHIAKVAESTAEMDSPSGCIPAHATMDVYKASTSLVSMGAAVEAVGGSQPHENRQPSLTINFCAALAGIYPVRP